MVSSGLIYSLLPQESVADDTFLMVISKICADMQSLKVTQKINVCFNLHFSLSFVTVDLC